jgi:hypothetical protein
MQNPDRKHRILLPSILAATLGLAGLPTEADAATLVDKWSMRLTTTYFLKASLDYGKGTIDARERITITNRAGTAISKVNLSVMPNAFGELESIGDITVDREPTTGAWTNDANFQVQLGRNLAHGETAVIRLGFSVRASSAIGTSLEARLSKANGIMQVSHWFPIVSNGHAMRYPGDSQYTFAATAIRLELHTESTAVRVAAPGSVIESSGRDHLFELKHARDYAFAVSPSFNLMRGSASGVNIKVFTTSSSGSTALSVAKAAVAKYEAVYGQYQWSNLVIAQSPRAGSGNEYPGIVFLGRSLLTNREEIAHEVAHQWWYAMVGNDQIKEPWLDEGLAQFSADQWFGGFATYRSSRPVNASSLEFPNVPAPLTSSQTGSYDQTIYFKASKFLAGLRSRMGTTAFFAAMRELFTANRNGVLTTKEFVAAMRRHGAPYSYLDAFLRL